MTFFVDGLSAAHGASREVRRIGEYHSLGDALLAAERIISEFLMQEYRPRMLPTTLLFRYQNFGEVPYIFRDDGETTTNLPGFNHLRYALTKCAEICQDQAFDFDMSNSGQAAGA
jgi:hypothetical protein